MAYETKEQDIYNVNTQLKELLDIQGYTNTDGYRCSVVGDKLTIHTSPESRVTVQIEPFKKVHHFLPFFMGTILGGGGRRYKVLLWDGKVFLPQTEYYYVNDWGVTTHRRLSYEVAHIGRVTLEYFNNTRPIWTVRLG